MTCVPTTVMKLTSPAAPSLPSGVVSKEEEVKQRASVFKRDTRQETTNATASLDSAHSHLWIDRQPVGELQDLLSSSSSYSSLSSVDSNGRHRYEFDKELQMSSLSERANQDGDDHGDDDGDHERGNWPHFMWIGPAGSGKFVRAMAFLRAVYGTHNIDGRAHAQSVDLSTGDDATHIIADGDAPSVASVAPQNTTSTLPTSSSSSSRRVKQVLWWTIVRSSHHMVTRPSDMGIDNDHKALQWLFSHLKRERGQYVGSDVVDLQREHEVVGEGDSTVVNHSKSAAAKYKTIIVRDTHLLSSRAKMTLLSEIEYGHEYGFRFIFLSQRQLDSALHGRCMVMRLPAPGCCSMVRILYHCVLPYLSVSSSVGTESTTAPTLTTAPTRSAETPQVAPDHVPLLHHVYAFCRPQTSCSCTRPEKIKSDLSSTTCTATYNVRQTIIHWQLYCMKNDLIRRLMHEDDSTQLHITASMLSSFSSLSSASSSDCTTMFMTYVNSMVDVWMIAAQNRAIAYKEIGDGHAAMRHRAQYAGRATLPNKTLRTHATPSLSTMATPRQRQDPRQFIIEKFLKPWITLHERGYSVYYTLEAFAKELLRRTSRNSALTVSLVSVLSRYDVLFRSLTCQRILVSTTTNNSKHNVPSLRTMQLERMNLVIVAFIVDLMNARCAVLSS